MSKHLIALVIGLAAIGWASPTLSETTVSAAQPTNTDSAGRYLRSGSSESDVEAVLTTPQGWSATRMREQSSERVRIAVNEATNVDERQLQTTTTSLRVVETDFDYFTDKQAASKTLDPQCGIVEQPCHIPVSVYVNQQPTLRQLVIRFFAPADWGWAIRAAFCESSAQPDDWYSDKVHVSSGATGWFQHMPQYWLDRSSKAGFSGFPANHPVANVGVAAWLLYSTPQGKGHWWPSRSCWETT
jgi:hypothetical protein